MSIPHNTSIRNIGLGLVALLVTLPLLYAQRSQPFGRGDAAARDNPAPRSVPVQHSPAMVDRSNHGSIRHVDTHVVQRPVEIHHEATVHQQVYVHHDVEVDLHRPQYWHHFVFGERRHALRAGYFQVFVNGAPYYYDDGIYYQQADDVYQAVYPPIGATIPGLPDGAVEIVAGNIIYYYVGGAFYIQQDGGFMIAPAPLGVIVPELPPGAVQVSVNNGVAYQFNGLYYLPVFVNGVTQYMTSTL